MRITCVKVGPYTFKDAQDLFDASRGAAEDLRHLSDMRDWFLESSGCCSSFEPRVEGGERRSLGDRVVNFLSFEERTQYRVDRDRIITAAVYRVCYGDDDLRAGGLAAAVGRTSADIVWDRYGVPFCEWTEVAHAHGVSRSTAIRRAARAAEAIDTLGYRALCDGSWEKR